MRVVPMQTITHQRAVNHRQGIARKNSHEAFKVLDGVELLVEQPDKIECFATHDYGGWQENQPRIEKVRLDARHNSS
jgi:hypothetical protein